MSFSCAFLVILIINLSKITSFAQVITELVITTSTQLVVTANTGTENVEFICTQESAYPITNTTDIPTVIPSATNLPTISNTPVVPSSTVEPSATVIPTVGETTPEPTKPPVTGDFPCGQYPEASPGCIAVSYQSWFDNVPATDRTMSVDYTPQLLHQHYECSVPAARENGQNLNQGMNILCQFVRYNSTIEFNSSNSGWYRSQNQGDTYEQFDLNLPACQNTRYEGKTCKSTHEHTVRSSDMSSSTEMRYTPNVKFTGIDGERHFLSSNWQTGIGYRNSSELTARYWHGICGTYQRTILKNSDKYLNGDESIPTVSGTISIPFKTNGGCGDRFKTFVFLDPKQHTGDFNSQTGVTLMEVDSHFDGDLTWDTTTTTNGVHSLLFINLEGTNQYVSASGVSVKYNVQN